MDDRGDLFLRIERPRPAQTTIRRFSARNLCRPA
jgi:hypothetical protein